MAQVNDIIKDNIISRALSVCELADGETMCLPQNTFARIRVRTQEQFLALKARRAAVQVVRVKPSDKPYEEERYYVLVPWEDIIRCAVHSNSL